MLADTLREMAGAGVKRALAVVLAAYSSYSSCRQYREDIERARDEVGPAAPAVDKMRVFYNHPDFIAANADRVREALAQVPAGERVRGVHLAFTAHSIPSRWPTNCSYESSFKETCRLVAATWAFRRAAGRSSTRAGAAGRRTPGSSRTSSTTCGR